MATVVFIIMGVLAGILTTVAGLGGGMALILALSLVMDPARALAITAPALLVGNGHRAYTFRHHVDHKLVRPILWGAVPGALGGGLAATALPSWVLRAVLLVVMTLAVLRAQGRLSFKPPRAALFPAGFGIGWLTAVGGGAGVLVGPVLLGLGLTGDAYIATSAVVGVTIHGTRMVAYGVGGLFEADVLQQALVLAVAIMAGNLLGNVVRRRMDAAQATRVELGVMVVSVLLAVAGVTR